MPYTRGGMAAIMMQSKREGRRGMARVRKQQRLEAMRSMREVYEAPVMDPFGLFPVRKLGPFITLGRSFIGSMKLSPELVEKFSLQDAID